MKLRFVWIKSSADSELVEVQNRYLNRIKHFFPIDVTEVAPPRGRQSSTDGSIVRAQSAALMGAIPANSHIVVLDERGRSMDSLKFAKWLERMTIDQPHGVTFVLGGDVGFDDTVRDQADTLLSLSAMVMPHQLARVVLLEQIYRACTLMRNIPYHK